jgi:hypothetical protein
LPISKADQNCIDFVLTELNRRNCFDFDLDASWPPSIDEDSAGSDEGRPICKGKNRYRASSELVLGLRTETGADDDEDKWLHFSKKPGTAWNHFRKQWSHHLSDYCSGVIDQPSVVLNIAQTETGSLQVVNLGGTVVAEFLDFELDSSEQGLTALKAKICEASGISNFRLVVNVGGSCEIASFQCSGYQACSDPSPASAVPLAPATTYTYEELKTGCPDGVESSAKENALSEAEFTEVFNMSKGEFYAMAVWKQQSAKKKAGLF